MEDIEARAARLLREDGGTGEVTTMPYAPVDGEDWEQDEESDEPVYTSSKDQSRVPEQLPKILDGGNHKSSLDAKIIGDMWSELLALMKAMHNNGGSVCLYMGDTPVFDTAQIEQVAHVVVLRGQGDDEDYGDQS